MGKYLRKRSILRYLSENDVMLTTGLLYANLKEYRNITFSKRTVKRLTYELESENLMELVDEGDGWYRISDKGRAYLAGDLEDSELED